MALPNCHVFADVTAGQYSGILGKSLPTFMFSGIQYIRASHATADYLRHTQSRLPMRFALDHHGIRTFEILRSLLNKQIRGKPSPWYYVRSSWQAPEDVNIALDVFILPILRTGHGK